MSGDNAWAPLGCLVQCPTLTSEYRCWSWIPSYGVYMIQLSQRPQLLSKGIKTTSRHSRENCCCGRRCGLPGVKYMQSQRELCVFHGLDHPRAGWVEGITRKWLKQSSGLPSGTWPVLSCGICMSKEGHLGENWPHSFPLWTPCLGARRGFGCTLQASLPQQQLLLLGWALSWICFPIHPTGAQKACKAEMLTFSNKVK